MSMSAHGSATLAWVCRCSSGLRSASSPAIHILAGEKVCIQAITPTHAVVGVGLEARRGGWRPASVSTGFQTTATGTLGGRVERVGDLAATARRPGEGLLAVQALAAGEEPDLVSPGCCTGYVRPV